MELIVPNGCTLPGGQQPPRSMRPCWESRSALGRRWSTPGGDLQPPYDRCHVLLLFLDFNEQGVKHFVFGIERVRQVSGIFRPCRPSPVWLPCSCHWSMWSLRIIDLSYQKISGPSHPSRHGDLQVDVSSKSDPITSPHLPLSQAFIPMCPFAKIPPQSCPIETVR